MKQDKISQAAKALGVGPRSLFRFYLHHPGWRWVLQAENPDNGSMVEAGPQGDMLPGFKSRGNFSE